MKIKAFDSIGPGKFANRAERRAWVTSLGMGAAEFVGNCSELGWCASLLGPMLGLAHAGVIVQEDDCGFVMVEFFDNVIALRENWEVYEKAAQAFYDAQESDG